MERETKSREREREEEVHLGERCVLRRIGRAAATSASDESGLEEGEVHL